MKISFVSVISTIFVAYVGHSVWTLWQLFIPPKCTSIRNHCVRSFLENDPKVTLALYTSTKSDIKRDADLSPLWYLEDFDYRKTYDATVNVSLPRSTRNNGTLYVHAFVTPKREGGASVAHILSSSYTSHYEASLTMYMVPEAETFNLLGSSEKKESESATRREMAISHWRKHLILSVMEDPVSFTTQTIPRELYHFTRLSPKKEYLPMLYIDTLQNRIKDFQPIVKNRAQMELNITYAPISFGRLRLQVQIQAAILQMAALGFTEKDTDEVKGIFLDTNLYLLCLTFIVAAFHLLFDFLAFKNDITFWKKKKTMVGMSTRTVIWRCFSNVVIFLYLMDENTSLLVLVPSGIATIIEFWKMKKVFKLSVRRSGTFLFSLQFGSTTEEERETANYDALSMKYLSYVLYPLCVGGAIYSLMYTPHRSWYSWCVQSMVNGVYAFGFLFMLPQLFVNYKHKSVAHLPWKAFMYKAFNTFIDDIFAFIITMPTAHRVACFRDDVVFLIYLYQRWLYPVDRSRVNEYGESFDEKEKAKKTK